MFRIILQALETTKVWRLEMWSDERRQFFWPFTILFQYVWAVAQFDT